MKVIHALKIPGERAHRENKYARGRDKRRVSQKRKQYTVKAKGGKQEVKEQSQDDRYGMNHGGDSRRREVDINALHHQERVHAV